MKESLGWSELSGLKGGQWPKNWGGGRASISNWSEVITLLMLGSPIFSSLEGRGACIIQSRSGVAKCSREGTESSS